MKPEEFDHRLNQKLDELHPVFEERDWNRFYGKYQAQSAKVETKSSNRKYLLLLLLLLFSIGVAYQMNAFQWLHSKWNTQNPVAIPVLVESSQKSIEQQKSNSNLESNPMLEGDALVNTTVDETKLSDKPEISNQAKTTNKTESSNSTKTTLNTNLTAANNSNIQKAHQIQQSINHIPSVQGSENPLQENKINNLIIKEQAIENTVGIQENVVIECGKIKFIDELNFLENLEISPLINEFKPKLNTKFIKAVHSFKYSVGALALVTEKHFNQGIAFELKTKKYISFSTGLIRQAYFEQAYSDSYSFSETTADEFSDLIKPRHSRSENIRNIRINAREWLLPLQLKYYLPFSSKYAAYFSGGIQLTLSSRVSMDFEYLSYVTQQVMSENDFDQASNRATLINQFNLGTGIQRSFHKLNCQLGVSLQKNNSNQSFISKYEPGIQLGLFYKI